MARLDDVELVDRLFLKGYPFRKFAPRTGDPVSTAMTPLKKPLEECSVTLVTTAGLSLPDQPPFDVAIKSRRAPLGEAHLFNLQSFHVSA